MDYEEKKYYIGTIRKRNCFSCKVALFNYPCKPFCLKCIDKKSDCYISTYKIRKCILRRWKK